MKKLVSLLLAAAMLVLPIGMLGMAERAVTLDIEQEWQNFDLGATHAAAVNVGALGYAWGYNYDGPVGNGSAAGNVTSPYNFGTGIKAVEANGKTTLYIDNNDTLWMVGQQYYGVGGNQGSLPISTVTPVQVDTNVKQVSFGSLHFMYVKNDGTLWTWGQNTFGELGDGTTTQNYTPQQILTDVAWCSAGYEHSAALKNDGTLYMWGMNDCGQVGNGSTSTQKTPVQVLTNVAAVSINGYHSCALKNDGTLWTWGDNQYGQCGNGSTSNVTSPGQVLAGVAQVSAGDFHTGVLKTDGTVWFCGSNYRGAFGNGSSTTYSTATTSFTQTSGSYVAVKCGSRMSAVVTPEGELFVAGENTYGKLGLGYEGNPNGSGPFVPTFTGNGVWIFGGDEPVYHTVTFVDWDGTVLSTQQVLEGESAVAPADPSREGYTFIGWDVSFANVTADITVTAQYEAISTLLLGDVDCDGDVDFADVALLSQFISGMAEITAQGRLNADMDQNGVINFGDVGAIYQYILN